MTEKQIKNVFLPQDIAVLAAIAAAGIVCFIPGGGWSGLGAIILLCWAMMVPFYRHGYRLRGQKGVFRMKEISLSKENKDEILAFLDGNTDIIEQHPRQPGGALVDVYCRKSDGAMLARYFDYADFLKGIEHPLREVSSQQVSTLESLATDKK